MTARAARRAVWWWLVISLGCSPRDTHSTDAFTVSDSAGIRIVYSRRPTWKPGQEWLVSTEPSLTIGAVDDTTGQQFGSVDGIVQLADGRIVVADAQSLAIRCFGPDGRMLWTSGGPGSGPGDFRSVTGLHRYLADSVLVHDRLQRRLSVIGPAGQFIRSWSLELPDDSTFSGNLFPVGVWADGSILVRAVAVRRGASPPRVTRRATRLFRYDASGEVLSGLGAFPGREWYEGEGYAIRSLPFARDTRFVVTASGVIAGTDDSFELRELRANGSIATLIRRPVPTGQISDEAIALERNRLTVARRAERATFFRGMPADRLARISESEERMYSSIPFPPTYPASWKDRSRP